MEKACKKMDTLDSSITISNSAKASNPKEVEKEKKGDTTDLEEEVIKKSSVNIKKEQKITRVSCSTMVPSERMNLVRGILSGKVPQSVHVYFRDEMIDLVGPADKVAEVKMIISNIPWTLTHKFEKGLEQTFSSAISEYKSISDYKRRAIGGPCKVEDVEIFLVDQEVIFLGNKGHCEDALTAIESILCIKRFRMQKE